MRGKEFTEQHVADDDPNSLAPVVAMEIHMIVKWQFWVCANCQHYSPTPTSYHNAFWSLCAKLYDCTGSYLSIYSAVRHSVLYYLLLAEHIT